MFKNQIGRNIEVYVDDLLVNSETPEQHLDDLREAFIVLRQYQMKLNSMKCAFGVLRKARTLDEECNHAFEALKKYLTSPPLLSQPRCGETLVLYLSISPQAASSALVRDEGGVQKHVYYTSQDYLGAETRYPRIEQLAFALVVNTRRLRSYFQAHLVRVLTEILLKKILQKPDASGSLTNWAVELSETGQTRTSHEGKKYNYAIKLAFKTINNEAENEALFSSLVVARSLGAKEVEIQHVLMAENQKVDKLAQAASGQEDSPLLEGTGAPEWALDIVKYIDANEVPNDRCEARKIRNKASSYTLVEGVLYRRGYSTPLLRCISFEKVQYVLAEVHRGICGDHSGGKVLAGKVMSTGYYWPRALQDAEEYVRKCKKAKNILKCPITRQKN
ncbi:uncharacterized protein LOC121255135 [Juglans microcarpa x Juglans regia]|uniref:uncharacterized protein LOC121255135 n=1 Tax=Juglans microcarpa x Juglans regia TaxID=2249226 RepID=UPI001B7EF268|nr:uncharacterized protein LOC121255135 [Juglans microcarpa x Juglans regia]